MFTFCHIKENFKPEEHNIVAPSKQTDEKPTLKFLIRNTFAKLRQTCSKTLVMQYLKVKDMENFLIYEW